MSTSTTTGTVYLLHLDPAYKHARHYVGWASNLEARLAHHRNGTGGNLCRVAVEAGSDLVLARTWEGTDRNFERQIKNSKNVPQLCPICNPQSAMNRRSTNDRRNTQGEAAA